MNAQIRIGQPYIEHAGEETRLYARIEGGLTGVMYFEVKEDFGRFFTVDRTDAFLAALLPFAMKNRMDIVSEAPVSRRLLYQIRHYLIPVLSSYMEGYRKISVIAESMEPLETKGKTATGWTGGVDSLYTLLRSQEQETSPFKVDYLMIANNGALESENNEDLLRKLVIKAENGAAAKYGLKVIGINTNIQEILDEPFLAVCPYRQAAVILALQKLFGTYLSSSCYEFRNFSFDPENCTYSEMALFDWLSTDCTRFYPAYGSETRIEKLEWLSSRPEAWETLHPCTDPLPGKNCGTCGKCVRTMMALFSLGTLDRFSGVFDTKYFFENFDWYMADTLFHRKNQHYGEALAQLRKNGFAPSPKAIRLSRVKEKTAEAALKNKDLFGDILAHE